MKRFVLDTNVVVSAALSPKGNSARIIDLIAESRDIEVFYCLGIILEYQEVLSRGYLKIASDVQSRMINAILNVGVFTMPAVSNAVIPDEDDRIFYDTAIENNAILITGNTKHYPNEPFIMTPTDFLVKFEQKETEDEDD